jgi:hypothetical protein
VKLNERKILRAQCFWRQWSEIVTCLVATGVVLFFVFEYALEQPTILSVAVSVGLSLFFFWWLERAIHRSLDYVKRRDFGAVGFDEENLFHYDYLHMRLRVIKFSEIEKIAIVPAHEGEEQTNFSETYWFITVDADKPVVISSMAENAWKIASEFNNKLSDFNISRTLSTLMSSRGIGHVIWKRQRANEVIYRETSVPYLKIVSSQGER